MVSLRGLVRRIKRYFVRLNGVVSHQPPPIVAFRGYPLVPRQLERSEGIVGQGPIGERSVRSAEDVGTVGADGQNGRCGRPRMLVRSVRTVRTVGGP